MAPSRRIKCAQAPSRRALCPYRLLAPEHQCREGARPRMGVGCPWLRAHRLGQRCGEIDVADAVRPQHVQRLELREQESQLHGRIGEPEVSYHKQILVNIMFGSRGTYHWRAFGESRFLSIDLEKTLNYYGPHGARHRVLEHAIATSYCFTLG